MQLNIQIEDVNLQEQFIQHFFNKEKSALHYKTQNPELSATTLDFDLESDKDYKLFQDVDDVKSYAKELRVNAWK